MKKLVAGMILVGMIVFGAATDGNAEASNGIMVDVAFSTKIPPTANAFEVTRLFMLKTMDYSDRVIVPDPGNSYRGFYKTVNRATSVHIQYRTMTLTCAMFASRKSVPVSLTDSVSIFPAPRHRYRVHLVVDRIDGTSTGSKNGCTFVEPKVIRKVMDMTVDAPGKKLNIRIPINGKIFTAKTIQVGRL